MKDTLTQEAQRARAAVEGRVAFAAAALLLAAGLVALIDRLGAPSRLVVSLAPAITLAGLAILGLSLQTARVSSFYGANRQQPARYVALGMAGLALGLAPPMLPPGPLGGGHANLLLGLVLGVVAAGLASGPLLRKSGAFSVASLFGARFASEGLRIAAAVVVALTGGLVAYAGFEGAVRGIDEHLGFSRFAGSMICGVALLAIIAPGGLASSVWSAAGATFVLATALLLPLAIHGAGGSPLPAPFLGQEEAWTAAVSRMARWSGETPAGPVLGLFTTAGVAVAVAALAPLLAPMIACRSARRAPAAGAGTALLLVLLVAAVLVAMAVAALTLEAQVVGRRPEALPSFVYAVSAHGLISICGQFVDGARAAALACAQAPGFAGLLGAEHVWASGRALLERMPEIAGLSPSIIGLSGAGFIAIALALAAAGAQCFAATLADDLLNRGSGRMLTSRRLALARLLMIALAVALSLRASGGPGASIQNALALALLLSGAVLAPLFLLCVWPRATSHDAAMAAGAGLCVCILTTFVSWRGGAFDVTIMASGALVGFCLATGVALAGSLRRSEEDVRPGRIFVQSLLHSDDDVIAMDKGA